MKRILQMILLTGLLATGLNGTGWMAIACSSSPGVSSTELESAPAPMPEAASSSRANYFAPTVGQPLRTEGGGTR